jgi:CelD/BcsL family acetyltransferase involved in cellulose biosynthesis
VPRAVRPDEQVQVPRQRSRTVQVLAGLPGPRLVSEWAELAGATGAPPWVRPGWLVPWWQHMGRGEPVLVLARSGSGELEGVLPLQSGRSLLRSPTNWHTPEFAVVAEAPDVAGRLLAVALQRSGTRLTLEFVAPGLVELLEAVSARHGGRVSSRVLESSPYVLLQQDWQARLDRRMLADLRRRRRRLEEHGEVAFDLQDGTTGLDRLLAEGLAVEGSGWKGKQGTAVVSSPATLAFYRAICAWAAREGTLRLAFLRVAGAAVAFDLGIEHAGTSYLLKTGYDERFGTLAPGKQLRLEALRDCAARGIHTYELLGDAQPWKQEWAADLRLRHQTHAFRHGTAGALGWTVQAGLLPAARIARDRMADAGALRHGLTRRSPA